MILRKPSAVLFLMAALAVSGCGDDEKPAVCTVGDNTTCDEGLVCEEVQGGDPACFEPIVLRGQVFDATTDGAVEGAEVFALDVNGEAVTAAVTTDASGNYELQVPTMRDADGNVLSGTSVTLRVDADDYLTFPKPPRFAIPVDLTVGVADGNGDLIVDNATTDVALFPIEAGTFGTITGTISEDAAGALVVAEQGGVAVATAIVDADGSFTLYNVPIGVSTEVTAYASGVGSDTVAVTIVNDGDTEDVTLTPQTSVLVTIEGDLNPVNAPNWSGESTSVLLVVESTFSELTRAGYTPSGLGDATLSSADLSFSIPGVPPGTYVVLSAFGNDGLVRDPDLSQGGTSIRHIRVHADGMIENLVDPLSGDTEDLMGIKVTDAIETVFPGAESLEVVTTAPTFQWSKDSGTDHYEFRIFDAYGALVYEDLAVAQPGGSGPVSYDTVMGNFLIGTGFDAGMIYQFRVASIETGGDTISTTEDLRGVFQFQP